MGAISRCVTPTSRETTFAKRGCRKTGRVAHGSGGERMVSCRFRIPDGCVARARDHGWRSPAETESLRTIRHFGSCVQRWRQPSWVDVWVCPSTGLGPRCWFALPESSRIAGCRPIKSTPTRISESLRSNEKSEKKSWKIDTNPSRNYSIK